MRKLASVGIILLCSMFFFSCQKEISSETLTPDGGSGNGGNGGNGGGGGTTQNSYHPLTNGSWWKYKDSTNVTISTNTVVNATKVFNNITYTGIVAGNGTQSDTAWAASPQPNYYLTTKGLSPNTGAPYDITFHYLNDTASVGYNWQYNAGQGNGFTALMKTTILGKNITMTVAGKTYNNVIHTNQILSYDIFGTVMDFASYDYFIAKGVGIIKVRAELGGFGFSMKTCSDLIDYQIR